MSYTSENNKRLAKNTILLYFRTIVVMLVTLYISRLILDTLGVEDYGIYNIVGGAIMMFSILSGALSSSISRFITYELGKGNTEKLHSVFSTSISIQLFLSIIVFVIGESLGWWFIVNTLNIPESRIDAAIWVMHCTIISFILNLINVPFNACIIAHEKMSAFAYICIFDVFLKLGSAIVLNYLPCDKLKMYAFLLTCVSIMVQLLYYFYCRCNFQEVKGHLQYDKSLLKEMSSFAGWNFLTNAAYVFNTQGINILINIFFGVGANAARGIASQVEGAVMKFINDFTTAVNPQITKSYAIGDFDNMSSLICRGAKFGFFLLLLISLPVLMETDTILSLWLNNVPDHTITFVRLAIVATMIDRLGMTGYVACMATGNIRQYVLLITSCGCLVFPLTLLAYKLGLPVEAAYVIFMLIYVLVDTVRLCVMKRLLGFSPSLFLKEVVLKIIYVSGVSAIIPCLVIWTLPQSNSRFFVSIFTCLLMTSISVYKLGLSMSERNVVKSKLIQRIKLWEKS